MNFIMVNSADANLPYLIRGHAVIVNIPHVQMFAHASSETDCFHFAAIQNRIYTAIQTNLVFSFGRKLYSM